MMVDPATQRILDGLRRVIARESHTSAHEQAVQLFFEQYPSLLPGLWDLHHGPAEGVVVSKPPLGDFVPDFGFVAKTTADYQFTFVELEDPCKRIFTQKGDFTSTFHQAKQQVHDWLDAFPKITSRAIDIFADVLPTFADWKGLWCKVYLVYGRRAEVERSRKTKERWRSLTAPWGPGVPLQILTYDRLLDPPCRPLSLEAINAVVTTRRYVDRHLLPVTPSHDDAV